MKTVFVQPLADLPLELRDEYHLLEHDNLGLQLLSAVAQQLGAEVELIVASRRGWDGPALRDYLVEQPPDLVGFSFPFTDVLRASYEQIALVRESLGPSILIIAGGHAASAEADWLLQAAPLDAVVMGEGERAIAAILQGKPWSAVPGAVFQHKGAVRCTLAEPVINLDELPPPDRRSVPPDADEVYLSVSRGCPFRCTFCDIKTFQRASEVTTWRGCSPERVVRELIEADRQFPAATKVFVDDQFFGPGSKGVERVELIAALLRQARRRKEWRSEAQLSVRAQTVACNPSTFHALRRAGFTAVYMGFDSGSITQLQRYRKDATVADNLEALRVLRAAKIDPDFGFIMFDPWVTRTELWENLTFLCRLIEAGWLVHYSCVLNNLRLYPGTPLYQRAIAEGRNLVQPYPAWVCDLRHQWLGWSDELRAIHGPVEATPELLTKALQSV